MENDERGNMERLTKRASFSKMFPEFRAVVYVNKDKEECVAIEMTSSETQHCLDKLADYEDLDERGMVIRNGDPIFANITFDKNDLQKMVNEKISEIELNIDTIKEQTIDEFVKMLHRYAFSNEYGTHIVFTPEQLDEMVAHWKAGEE